MMWLIVASLALMVLGGSFSDIKDQGDFKNKRKTKRYKCPTKKKMDKRIAKGRKCNVDGKVCLYGRECCCGECYHSERVECHGDEWMLMNTDACLNYDGCCNCPRIYQPVCGEGDKPFHNVCEARCKGVKIECEHQCPCEDTSDTVCPELWQPVCSTKSVTYGNECKLAVAMARKGCDGECPCDKSDVCITLFEPVCSTVNETYPNDCRLKEAKAEKQCEGQCPCLK